MNSFGRILRVSIFGESHGFGAGILIDGCPPGISFTEQDMDADLARRKPGMPGTTPRQEEDRAVIFSGVIEGKTTGAPIMILFNNLDKRSEDYDSVKNIPRPGHADLTSSIKYFGFNDLRGGGHFSGRLTLGLVAAGVLAKKIIHQVNIHAEVIEAGGNKNIEQAIADAQRSGDSIGSLVECRATGVPAGLGEPFFESVESLLSHNVFSIPAIKGIEFGAGFQAARMKGSEMNDAILDETGKTKTNHSGGINGGITNGNELVFRVAVKPASSISKSQETYSFETGKLESLEIKGRHDVCIGLRVPPVLEAAVAITLADLYLIRLSQIKFNEIHQNEAESH